jgi:hypothetical protein
MQFVVVFFGALCIVFAQSPREDWKQWNQRFNFAKQLNYSLEHAALTANERAQIYKLLYQRFGEKREAVLVSRVGLIAGEAKISLLEVGPIRDSSYKMLDCYVVTADQSDARPVIKDCLLLPN